MEWIEDVERKLKRKNMVLFSRDSLLLQELNSMIQQLSHQVLVLWAMELAQETVDSLAEKYPTDTRPASALETAKAWAAGSIKMPMAQRAILDCHAMAKELSSMEDIALCHAVGQACSVVHVLSDRGQGAEKDQSEPPHRGGIGNHDGQTAEFHKGPCCEPP